MTPNFALSLSFEGIRLLQRGADGWLLVDEVALDDADLGAALARIKERAAQLDPSPLRTKLLIPNDQIRYLALDNPRADEDDIRASLDGATPYALDDLVFDYSRGGGRTYVAAIARETLDEAEGFAAGYGFNPVSFAAVPDAFTFVGEAFFGRTSAAASLLTDGQTIERDVNAVVVVGRVAEPEPEPELEPEMVEEPPVVEPEAVEEAVVEPTEDAQAEAEQVELEFDIDLDIDLSAIEETPAPVEAEPKAAPEPAEEPEEPAEPVVFSSRARTSDATTPTLTTGDKATATIQPRITPTITPTVGIPPAPSDLDATPVFAATPRTIPTETKQEDKTSPLAPVMAAAASAKTALADGLTALNDRRKARRTEKDAERDAAALAKLEAKAQEVVAELDGDAEPADEKVRLTIFGARRKAQAKAIKRPKYVFAILMALLLAFLLAVAIWSSTLENGIAGLFGGSDVTVATLDADNPAPEDEAAADLGDAMSDVDIAIENLTQDGALLPPTDLPLGQVLSPAEAQRLYAATGVWQRAPTFPYTPKIETTDGVTIAAIDPVTFGTDAVALPSITAMQPDLSVVSPLAPPAAGTEFDRDANGNIRATEAGTVLPTGITVFAATATTTRPIARPDGIAPNLEAAPTTNPNLVTAGGVSLASLRPRSRPDNLAENIERDTLGGYTASELAALRPRARPDNLVIVAPEPEPLPIPEADVDAIAAAIAAAAPPDLTAGASQYAVSSSPLPISRPRNFDRIVTATAASLQSEPEASAPTDASATMRPTGSVPGGVARAATENNVLTMRDIALIGIAGSSSSRIALVRMGNGRIVSVRVGDTLDGGRVTAIGESVLNYEKRGRVVSLEMPRG
ncbi:MAG: hypothetical protein HWD91_09145 [Marivivens sp.]|uniref:hypothetical protein n=1 Tax=Marivivens sp. TaxID=1978374 RepID=UPI001811B3F0|nr:hypothetical protein [Marivivens sp.]NVJ95739.1 hypothetical protein [Marivivens sp.]